MRTIFEALREQMRQGEDCVLLTVVSASGSVPRSAGAYMVANVSGRCCGTIGGGILEYRALERVARLLEQEKETGRWESFVETYDLSNGEAASLGMVCGGQAEVLFCRVDAEDVRMNRLAERVLRAEQDGTPYWLLLPLDNGEIRMFTGEEPESQDLQSHALHREITELDGQRYYAEQFLRDGCVYLLGGGHLAQETAPLLAHLGFRCVVADDREGFTKPELFPGAKQVCQVDFSALERRFAVQSEDYILIMTRGHQCDIEAERFALGTSACYIGVVGSRRKAAYVREKLSGEGFSEELLDRVITPVGLDIGSETPAEIAVSIAAQLISVRAEKYRQQ